MPSQSYVTERDVNLGSWCEKQRGIKDRINYPKKK